MSGEAATRVVVQGALGRMGTEILAALGAEADMRPVGAVDVSARADTLSLPGDSGSVPLSASLDDLLASTDADVVVDVTNAEGALTAIRSAATKDVGVVVGSSGISESTLDEARALAEHHGVGIIVVPNFAIGGVVMTHLARIAARFFDCADLVETHHNKKIDAPSGTAISIAKAVVEGKGGPMKAPAAEKETVPGTRGGDVDGVTIHSVRLPGRLAHHELVFGGPGQTLTIRHDSIDRSGFMPGVIAAVRAAASGPGLTVGLEEVLGLK